MIEKFPSKCSEYLYPHKNKLLYEISKINQKEIRGHICQIIPRLELNQIERNFVFKLFKEYLNDDIRIVKTFVIQALFDLAQLKKNFIPEVKSIIYEHLEKGTPAMKYRA